jgi:membrane fusion protein, multidrug efflux system
MHMPSEVAELEKDLNSSNRATETPRPAKNGPNSKVRGIILAGVIAAVVAGTIAYLYYHNRVSTDDAEVDGHIIPMASKVYGTVSAVFVHENERVRAGQALVRIDPRDYQVKVDQERAALAAAESNAKAAAVGVPWTNESTLSGTTDADAGLSAAQANYDRARMAYQQASTSDLAFAQAQVESAQAANDKAQADLARMRPLAAKAEISQQELDSYTAAAQMAASGLKSVQEKLAAAKQAAQIAQASLAAAQARVKGAQAAVSGAQANRKQVAIRTADVASAKAAVQQAKANLEAAELDLSYTTITAPSDGVVTHKTVEVGEIVQPGQDFFVLVPLNDVWVTANYKETQLAHVRPGQKAEVHVDMYGKSFSGHVDSIAGATGSRLSLLPPENATGNFVKVVQRIPVKILLDPIPPDQAVLRPGMNVDATIFTR